MEKSKFSARVLALWVVCWLRFQDDEIDWTHALDALKRARVQLDELDLDQESSQNPAKFFDKVRGAPAAPPNPRVGWRKLSGLSQGSERNAVARFSPWWFGGVMRAARSRLLFCRRRCPRSDVDGGEAVWLSAERSAYGTLQGCRCPTRRRPRPTPTPIHQSVHVRRLPVSCDVFERKHHACAISFV